MGDRQPDQYAMKQSGARAVAHGEQRAGRARQRPFAPTDRLDQVGHLRDALAAGGMGQQRGRDRGRRLRRGPEYGLAEYRGGR